MPNPTLNKAETIAMLNVSIPSFCRLRKHTEDFPKSTLKHGRLFFKRHEVQHFINTVDYKSLITEIYRKENQKPAFAQLTAYQQDFVKGLYSHPTKIGIAPCQN